jgi:hypothetical protein
VEGLTNWTGVRVLVTGHTGFKGAWLSRWLTRLGADVFGYSDGVPTSPSVFEAAGVGHGLAGDLRGDIADEHGVGDVVASSRPHVGAVRTDRVAIAAANERLRREVKHHVRPARRDDVPYPVFVRNVAPQIPRKSVSDARCLEDRRTRRDSVGVSEHISAKAGQPT